MGNHQVRVLIPLAQVAGCLAGNGLVIQHMEPAGAGKVRMAGDIGHVLKFVHAVGVHNINGDRSAAQDLVCQRENDEGRMGCLGKAAAVGGVHPVPQLSGHQIGPALFTQACAGGTNHHGAQIIQ